MEIGDLISECHSISTAKGIWDKERSVGDLVSSLHSDITTILEQYKDSIYDSRLFPNWQFKEGNPVGFAISVADLCIDLFDLCGYYRIDLDTAIAASLNKRRKSNGSSKK